MVLLIVTPLMALSSQASELPVVGSGGESGEEVIQYQFKLDVDNVHEVRLGDLQDFCVESYGRISVQMSAQTQKGNWAVFLVKNTSRFKQTVTMRVDQKAKKVVLHYGKEKPVYFVFPSEYKDNEPFRGFFFTGTKPKAPDLLVTIKYEPPHY